MAASSCPAPWSPKGWICPAPEASASIASPIQSAALAPSIAASRALSAAVAASPLMAEVERGVARLLSAPLLMYHAIQIVLGGVLVPSVRAWARRHAEPAGAEIV